MKCYLDPKAVHLEAEMLRNEVFANNDFMDFLQTDLDEGGVFFNYDLPNHTHMTYKWYYLIKVYHCWKEHGEVDWWTRHHYIRTSKDSGYRAERWLDNTPKAAL